MKLAHGRFPSPPLTIRFGNALVHAKKLFLSAGSRLSDHHVVKTRSAIGVLFVAFGLVVGIGTQSYLIRANAARGNGESESVRRDADFNSQHNVSQSKKARPIKGFIVERSPNFLVVQSQVLALNPIARRGEQLVYPATIDAIVSDKNITEFGDTLGGRVNLGKCRRSQSVFRPVSVDCNEINFWPKEFISPDVVTHQWSSGVTREIQGLNVLTLGFQQEFPFAPNNWEAFSLNGSSNIVNARFGTDWEGVGPRIKIIDGLGAALGIHSSDSSNAQIRNEKPILQYNHLLLGATSNDAHVPGSSVYTLTICSKNNRIAGDENDQGGAESVTGKNADDDECTQLSIGNPEPAKTLAVPLHRPRGQSH